MLLIRIWQTHRKQCIFAGLAVFAAVLIPAYLYFMFQKGIWYQDAFLLRQGDGCFAGRSRWASYALCITGSDDRWELTFTANGETRQYAVVPQMVDCVLGEHPGAQFYEDDELVCEGVVLNNGPERYRYWVTDRELNLIDGLKIQRVSDEARPPEDLFPGYSMQYSWTAMAQAGEWDTRGEPLMLLPALIAAFFLWVDLLYPDLNFILSHRRWVDGDSEPSEYYRTWQKIGRVVLGVVIVGCLVVGLGVFPGLV